jgi:hypothetical protein
MCSKGRFNSKAFQRWRSQACWTTHVVFVDYEEVVTAKQLAARARLRAQRQAANPKTREGGGDARRCARMTHTAND